MMKQSFLILFICLFKIQTCGGQIFNSLPPGFNFAVISLYFDSISNILYAGGNFWQYSNGVDVNYIAQWNGSQWDSLEAGVLGDVFAISKFNGEIYAGGNFSIFGNVNAKSIAKWNGINWQAFGNVNNTGSYSTVLHLNVLNNELYVFGNFDSIGNLLANGIAKYNGQNWFGFPNLDSIGYFNASAWYNGELYVGGNFDGGPGLQDIAKFDGNNWVSVGGGLSGPNSSVSDMKIFQNKLCIVGNLLIGQGDPGNGIATWDGGTWSQAGSGLLPSTVSSLHEFHGELYAGGAILNAGGVPVTYIAKWDGTSWYSLGANFDNKAGCFASYNNDLYIGGGFLAINGDTMNYITKYNFPVGIEENESNEKEPEIEISPNPATNYFEINSNHNSINKIQLFDISGKVVMEKQHSGSSNCRIDVAAFGNGIYTVKVISENTLYIEKLIIQKL
ncbi:MAG: T9SS type A sorting domain-containing protein [Bacteroidetes bacterium]|nr:T9SS type A sorting domain-containing protein [Bacteroidota bacterium]